MKSRWKGLGRATFALALCLVLLACGGDPEPDTPPPPAEPDTGEIRIPIPEPKRKPLHEQARGVYQLEAPRLRVSLELMRGRAFRFLSTSGDERREATGTWSLTASRLTLAYTHMNGKSMGAEPLVVVNVWRGRTIELKDTGLPGRVILTKRAMIRQR